MSNPANFARKISKISKIIEKAATDAVRQVALVVDQATVMGTPVDTGRARSNWRVTVGTPATGTIPPYSPGSRLGMGESANASRALDQAFGVISSYKRGPIWITNNLPYIKALENENRSPQNQFFVKAAVQKGKAILKRVTLLRITRGLKKSGFTVVSDGN